MLIAHSQGGVISRAQALAAGMTDSAIAAQIRAGRWRRVHRGVFAVHTGPLPRGAQIWAALLAIGPDAVASHHTAAELWGFSGIASHPLWVSVPGHRRVVAPDGVVVSGSSYLPQSRHPSASPPRTRVEATVADLVAAAPGLRDAIGAITCACQPRLTTPDRLRVALEGRTIRWRQLALDVVADVSAGATTPLELAFLRRVERPHGLPTAHRQRHRRAGSRVQWIDADYVEFRTRVELDGRLGHVGEGAFRDRRRDNRSTIEGWDTLRYGWVEVYEESCEVAGEVGGLLTANGWRGVLRPCGLSCSLRAVA